MRTLENWEQAAQAQRPSCLLINLVKYYPDTVQRLAHLSVRPTRALRSGEYAHAIISRMFEDSRSEQIRVRVIRNGLPEPPDNDWSMVSPEERIEAVWTLTELCLAWNKSSSSEPRLQRTVTSLQRAQR